MFCLYKLNTIVSDELPIFEIQLLSKFDANLVSLSVEKKVKTESN